MAPCATVMAVAVGDTVERPKGTWATSTTPSLTFNEKLYNNWSAAGNSLISFIANYDGTYKYTHPKFIVDNVFKLGLGVDMQDLNDNRNLESQRKSEDKIDLTTTYSRKIFSWMNVSASVNFKSQFLAGRTYSGPGNDEGKIVSKFMAPAYLTTSIGYEYKTSDWNGSISFLSGKTTMVFDEEVINAGQLYGIDTTGGKRMYQAIGSYIKFYFKKDIFTNFNLYTKLELFYDYNKPDHVNWDNESPAYDTYIKRLGRCMIHETDVNFEITANYKITRRCALTASLNMKYDTDFARVGQYGHWQMYQTAGLRLFFNWKHPE
ncbi:MAG: DUF3078 domain-containing protein [Bacteroidales bacterium]|nr:DUF3078 domain-containing protein [Bacteroidales bacterium]